MVLFEQSPYDLEGNLIVPRHGIRIALLVAALAAAVFCWYLTLENQRWLHNHPSTGASGVPDPQWLILLWITLPLVPFIASEALLSLRNEEWIAAGAGMAAALVAGSAVYGILEVLSLIFMSLSPDPYLKQQLLVFVVFAACCVWVAIAAGRIAAKVRSGAFVVAGVITLVSMIGAQRMLRRTEIQLDQEHEVRKSQAVRELFQPVVEAQHVLTSLAGCLILNESVHPETGYPRALDPEPPDWRCERKFAAKAVKEYSIIYSALMASGNGRVSDFQLVATPLGTPVRGRYPLMVDSRGIVFSALWESPEHARAATSEARQSEIWQLQRSIQQYMDEKHLTVAPLQLNAEMVGKEYGSEVPRIQDDGITLEIQHYVFHYQRPRPGQPSQFAISVQCQSYGQDCLRSYFLDYGGILHATGEPRAATSRDPPAMDCEGSDTKCAGVDWPVL